MHKFSIKDELARMQEALDRGYLEEDNEKPVDLAKLLKLFQTKKVIHRRSYDS